MSSGIGAIGVIRLDGMYVCWGTRFVKPRLWRCLEFVESLLSQDDFSSYSLIFLLEHLSRELSSLLSLFYYPRYAETLHLWKYRLAYVNQGNLRFIFPIPSKDVYIYTPPN